jgi:hypothetical protein
MLIKEVVDFLLMRSKILPHVSASGCHLQVVVGALYATQAMLCVWEYTDYDPSRVANWPHGTGHNP